MPATQVPPKPKVRERTEKEKAPSTPVEKKPKKAVKAPEPVKTAEKPKPRKKPKELTESKKPTPQIATRPQPTPLEPKTKQVEPAPFTPIPPPPPLARPLPPPPKPPRPPASAPSSVKVPAQTDGVPLPSVVNRARYGRWVLKPLTLNAGHECGSAGITGSIRLTKKRGNRYVGSLRRTINWSRCKPEGAIYNIVLVIRGQSVTMLASGIVLDRGTISGDTMVLKDAYGASTWRRVQ